MAKIPGSVQVAGFFAPTDDTDVYPVTDPIWGKDGHRSVADLTERDAITTERRREGMLCYVQSETKTYQLQGGITNSDWVEFSSGGSSTSDTTFTTNCTSTESVGDAVYIYNNGQVKQANASSITTAKVVGFIIEKPTDTTCVVQIIGQCSVFTNLFVNKAYFLSETPGKITTIPPATSGAILTQVGVALTQTKLIVGLSHIYTKRS